MPVPSNTSPLAGNEKKAVFKDDQNRINFLNTLQHVNKRYNWLCHAYCLMDNHYHLLIDKIFPKNEVLDKSKRDKKIIDAVQKYG